MHALFNRRRVTRLSGFAGVQLVVQMVGFMAGIVLVRYMEPVQYGYYTLAVSMTAVAAILADLGVSTAVLAIGGRLAGGPTERGELLTAALTLQGRLLALAVAVAAPAALFLLLKQGTPLWQALTLAVLLCSAAALQVRAAAALSVARLLGHLALQQRLELAVNAGKLAVLVWLAVQGAAMLDASTACLVNMLAAAAYLLTMRRHCAVYAPRPVVLSQRHLPALLAHVRKQAPNSIYFLLSSQIGVWLIGVFGSAERVAEVGALGRLAALFTVVSAVGVALVQPYFARRQRRAELVSGLASVNAFFVLLLALLLSAGAAMPQAILWVLGGHYGGLQHELLWLLAAATLSAWGGMLYGVGCARGWVLPFWLNVATGVLITSFTALSVDLATVRGSLVLNTAVAGVGLVVVMGYLWWQLRRPDSLSPALL